MRNNPAYQTLLARLKPFMIDGYRLSRKHFAYAMAAAFMLHMLALLAYSLAPRTQVIDVPVRVLNIKLGDGDAMANMPEQSTRPDAPNHRAVENIVAKMVRPLDNPKPKPAPQNQAFPAPEDSSNSAKEAMMPLNVPKQYVRAPGAQATGNSMGNSVSSQAELISRYEQVISLWIQRFKRYPEEARLQQITGATIVRVRIDRQGNIGYYALEKTTGSPILDRAAIDMIRRANPVPAVPPDYPPGELFEFLIPVNFQLQ